MGVAVRHLEPDPTGDPDSQAALRALLARLAVGDEGAFELFYDAERYGARLVASPRHADALLVTGPVTRNMQRALRRTYEAVPAPKVVVAVGDCARNCGVFAGAYGVAGAVADVVPVDLDVPGCPPRPEAIVEALRTLTDR